MSEQAVMFGAARSLVGIATPPSALAGVDGLPGVLLLNAGLLHRVGPNRIYVKLARALSEAGFPVLRFDLSGIGDSLASTDEGTHEERGLVEIGQAMDYLGSSMSLNRFVIIGLCSGADAAFRAASADVRVVGAVLINGTGMDRELTPEDIEEASASIRARYYRTRFLDPKSWLRVLSGKSNWRGIAATLSRMFRIRLKDKRLKDKRREDKGREDKGESHPAEADRSRHFRFVEDRGTRLLAIYSEGSLAWDVSQRFWKTAARSAVLKRLLRTELVLGSDHVFTLLWSQQRLTDLILDWMIECQPGWSRPTTVSPADP